MKIGRKKEKKPSEDFLAQEAREEAATAPEYTLDIPDDEIWTYKIEGLQAPHVGREYENATVKKVVVVLVLLVAISCSIYLSIRAVHRQEFEYEANSSGHTLVKYSNPGETTELRIDYVDGDETMPITEIAEYAINCDEKLETLYLGKDVCVIDAKSFYSCWRLENIYVDEENPYFCDLDGVLYTKDMKQIILYPIDHDVYMRRQTGFDNLLDDNGQKMEDLWGVTERYDEEFLKRYNQNVRTYVIPSSVEVIGQLAFAYANLTDIYMPQGIKRIESMGVFKATLENIYSYTCNEPITDTTLKAVDSFDTMYLSLPEGLEFIGSDAFSYNKGMTYAYIPASVTQIGHHAFFESCYAEDGTVKGLSAISIESDENSFKSVKTGDQWAPEYNSGLFSKKVDITYSAQRQQP